MSVKKILMVVTKSASILRDPTGVNVGMGTDHTEESLPQEHGKWELGDIANVTYRSKEQYQEQDQEQEHYQEQEQDHQEQEMKGGA